MSLDSAENMLNSFVTPPQTPTSSNNLDAVSQKLQDMVSARSTPSSFPDQKSIMEQAILAHPFFRSASGEDPIANAVGKGFQQYEAAKASFLIDAIQGKIPTHVVQAALGQVKSEFAGAKLKGSDLLDFGDVFRKMGLPEEVCASLGFALEMASDIPLGKGLGEVARGFISTPSGGAMTEKAWGQLIKWRGNKFVQMIEGVLKGEKFGHGLPQEQLETLRYGLQGENGATSLHAGVLAGNLERIIGGDINKASLLNRIITNTATPEDLKVLNKADADIVAEVRRVMDEGSIGLAEQVKLMKDDPDVMAALKKKFNLGEERIKSPEDLIETILANVGSYVKKSYLIFNHDDWKPSPEVFEGAKNWYVAHGKTETEATQILNDILATHRKDRVITLPKRKITSFEGMKIDQGSFISRKNIPEPIREFMGEIKDPAYNFVNTITDVTTARTHFKVLKALKDQGVFVKAKDATHTVKVPAGNPLAWGVIENTYTTPAMAEAMDHLQRQSNVMDRGLQKMMRFMKTAKTIWNPKTHAHNTQGNLWFAALADTLPVGKNIKYYKDMLDIWDVVGKVKKGELTTAEPLYQKWLAMAQDTVIGTEAPQFDKMIRLKQLVDDPYSEQAQSFSGIFKKGLREAGRWMAEMYAGEDQLFKGAAYLKYLDQGMNKKAAVEQVYKWFPNYAEASKLAEYARSSTSGLMILNPFTTFRTEAHRIALNAIKDSNRTRALFALNMSSRVAINAAVLGFGGMGFKDIVEYFLTDPKAVGEKINLGGNTAINLKYVDPFNTGGLFAPLLALSGATGVNPFDYVLDFTNFNPEFGYSNLMLSAMEPLLTGKGRFGQDLAFKDAVTQGLKDIVGSSFGSEVPKMLDPEADLSERYRRLARFFGIDVEKKDSAWTKKNISRRIKEKLANGEDVDGTLAAADMLGFKGRELLKNAKSSAKKKQKEAQELHSIQKGINAILGRVL